MNNRNNAYCNYCEDLVEYVVSDEVIKEEFKGELIEFKFKVGRCKCCNREVATDIEYNYRKSEARAEAYKKAIGIITLDEITEILDKYDLGKENLADVMGFGKVTIKRYYEGFYPSKEYSDSLMKLLDNELLFMEMVEKNKDKLKDTAFKKIVQRYQRLRELSNSKILQIANYIVISLEEVTPLALEKLLFFSNGVNYALNGTQLISEQCQAWMHGPVYPVIYNRYKKYGYKPIDDGIRSGRGCMLSKLTDKEIEAINLVINTFGLYSPKILEKISHSQEPWKEKRVGIKEKDAGTEAISEVAVKEFYEERGLNSEKAIAEYIAECIRG